MPGYGISHRHAVWSAGAVKMPPRKPNSADFLSIHGAGPMVYGGGLPLRRLGPWLSAGTLVVSLCHVYPGTGDSDL